MCEQKYWAKRLSNGELLGCVMGVQILLRQEEQKNPMVFGLDLGKCNLGISLWLSELFVFSLEI